MTCCSYFSSIYYEATATAYNLPAMTLSYRIPIKQEWEHLRQTLKRFIMRLWLLLCLSSLLTQGRSNHVTCRRLARLRTTNNIATKVITVRNEHIIYKYLFSMTDSFVVPIARWDEKEHCPNFLMQADFFLAAGGGRPRAKLSNNISKIFLLVYLQWWTVSSSQYTETKGTLHICCSASKLPSDSNRMLRRSAVYR